MSYPKYNNNKKVWCQKFDLITVHELCEMANWCSNKFGETGWRISHNTFYFDNEEDYIWFKMRWS